MTMNMTEKHDSFLPRPVRDSQSEMNEIVLPNDTNPLGALLGGRLMHWIDMAAAMAAHRHSHQYVVTAIRESGEEKRRYEDAGRRRELRRAERERRKANLR